MVSNLYPFKSNFFDVKGFKMHYLDEGEGDPIVMLHGNPTWSFYFRSLVSTLKDHYRIIVPDHIGMGLSDKPDDSTGKYSYTLKQRVKDIEDLLWHLKIKKDITLVMHDWGGMIGMAYAARRPEAVKRFIVFNSAAFPLPKTKEFPWQLSLIKKTPLGALLVQGLNLFVLGAVKFCCPRYPLPDDIKAMYLKPYSTWQNRLAVLRFVQDIPESPKDYSYPILKETEEGLEKLADHPMLICWGEKDFIFDGQFLIEWMNRFPKAEVQTFVDAGHYVLEDAIKEIIPLVKTFLYENPIKKAK